MDKIKKALSEVRGIVALVSGFVSFLFIMSVVGNPHVAETFLAIGVGLFVGMFVYLKLPKSD